MVIVSSTCLLFCNYFFVYIPTIEFICIGYVIMVFFIIVIIYLYYLFTGFPILDIL